MSETSEAARENGQLPYPKPAHAWWSAVVFFILYNLSFIDRQMINLLVDPIRATLEISDFEISLLQGFAFAIFYCLLGVPIGWLVDHKPRRPIVAAGVLIWSIAAAACGLATRFWHMALARIGVAAGEATLAPAAYSMMSDMFPPKKLAFPMSLMGTGAALGTAAAGLIAGAVTASVGTSQVEIPVLGSFEAWQVAFLVAGIPGLLLVPLIYTVRDPVRRLKEGARALEGASVVNYFAENRRLYSGHMLGFAVYSMCNYGFVSWVPSFLIRIHDQSLADVAWIYGGLTLVFGLFGGLLMGFVVDRWFSSGRRDAHLRFFAMMALMQMVSVTIAVNAGSLWLSVAFLAPVFAVQSFTGVGAAALQIITPATMRGQMSAIYLLIFNLVGLGLGPTVVAIFTDYLFGNDMMVGQSIMLTFLIFSPITTILMLWAAPKMSEKLEREEAATA